MAGWSSGHRFGQAGMSGSGPSVTGARDSGMPVSPRCPARCRSVFARRNSATTGSARRQIEILDEIVRDESAGEVRLGRLLELLRNLDRGNGGCRSLESKGLRVRFESGETHVLDLAADRASLRGSEASHAFPWRRSRCRRGSSSNVYRSMALSSSGSPISPTSCNRWLRDSASMLTSRNARSAIRRRGVALRGCNRAFGSRAEPIEGSTVTATPRTSDWVLADVCDLVRADANQYHGKTARPETLSVRRPRWRS